MKISIQLTGRIDTANAATTDELIANRLKAERATSADTVIADCGSVEYISSTGLRIFLKYKKLYPLFEVVNVQSEVYNVFEISGFTRILAVRKALRRVSIAGCKEIGRGGVGVIYRFDDDTIIKVFAPECSIDIPERERVMAREAFVLGMPTAIPFDIVWVEETQSYGMMTELLDAKTLGAMVNDDQDNFRYYARLYGSMLRNLHQIRVEGDCQLPKPVDVYSANIERIAHHFSPEQVELIRFLVSMVPEGNSLLHCDCHPKNIMIRGSRGEEELLLIDMGEVCCGHPLFELLNVRSTFQAQNFEALAGFPQRLSEPFWLEALKAYFGTDGEQLVNEYNEIITAASVVRGLTWIALGKFPKEVIDGVRHIADTTLWENRDFYIRMAERFKDFPTV